jgi:hypothetical protein
MRRSSTKAIRVAPGGDNNNKKLAALEAMKIILERVGLGHSAACTCTSSSFSARVLDLDQTGGRMRFCSLKVSEMSRSLI